MFTKPMSKQFLKLQGFVGIISKKKRKDFLKYSIDNVFFDISGKPKEIRKIAFLCIFYKPL